MLFDKQKLNSETVVFQLLKYFNIGISEEIINDELGKHPDYPSLLAVSDVLSSFNIDNNAFEVTFDELDQINYPFIAHTNIDGSSLVLVTKGDDRFFYVSSEKWIDEKIDHVAFKRKYSGIILTTEVDKDVNIEKPKRSINVDKDWIVLIGGIVLLFFAITYHSNFLQNLTVSFLCLVVTKTSGLIVSLLLLIQSIDANNPLVKAICRNDGNLDCNAILSTDAANVPVPRFLPIKLTWSEVGFFYFSGTWLLLLFSENSSEILKILSIFNIISLPYTIYSIYYQARVARKWCLLCCSIQALLWLEFLIFALTGTFSIPFVLNITIFSTLIICLFIPVILWIGLKPTFLAAQKVTVLKEQVRKFKYNADFFNMLLKDGIRYSDPEKEYSVVLGNDNPNTILTIITNPYCGPCASTHKELEKLMNQRQDVQIRILFSANNTDEDVRTEISRHLMALYELVDKNTMKEILHDWYNQKNKIYKDWAKKYPVFFDQEKFRKLDHQYIWCQSAGITDTPTIFVNGYKLPELYKISDLTYILE